MSLWLGTLASKKSLEVFSGQSLSYSTLELAMQQMFNKAESISQPGGSLTINGVSLGNYDYTIIPESSTASNSWFTSSADTRPALIYVNGNLTVPSGTTIIPPTRKLFTAIYVNGNLTVNGNISMSLRGANHSGTGNSSGFISPGSISIASGTIGGVSNPSIPSSGGNPGAGISWNSSFSGPNGNPGSPGSGGGTGGGGGGGAWKNNSSSRVANSTGGTAGTSFTGGSGGGGDHSQAPTPPTNPVANGGAGGNSARGPSGRGSGDGSEGGGAGNPAGYSSINSNLGTAGFEWVVVADNGTGGVLIIFCNGTLSGSGIISANGGKGNDHVRGGGGGSGGGSITVICQNNSFSGTVQANGGPGGAQGAGQQGGAGGLGTARILVR